MEMETREAALCVFRRGGRFLFSEVRADSTGGWLHRPPGGGIEAGETPEQAVRREVLEELGITLTEIRPLGPIEHKWFCNGREVRERAWIFLAEASDDPRLARGDAPELLEADGQRLRTLWRSLEDSAEGLPRLCPERLGEVLRGPGSER